MNDEVSSAPPLPNGWLCITLAEIISPSEERVDPTEAAGTFYIGLEHIEKNTGCLSGHGYASEVKSAKTRFHTDDLLYGRLRPYLNKAYVAERDGICSTDILVFPNSHNLSSKFLLYRILCGDFVTFASHNMSGVQHPRVSFNALSRFPLSLPPLPEQHRIVAKIEEFVTKLDAGVEALKTVRAQLNRYCQSVLKHAFDGKLTAEWRETHKHELEPASVLLDRIKRERQKTAGSKFKKLPSLDTSDLPKMPEGWIWSNFEELKKVEKNSIKAGPFGSSLKKESYTSHGYKIYGQEQVIRQEPSYGNYYISEEKYMELKSCAVKPGDILISLVGTIGKVLILPEDSEPGIINPRLVKLSLEERLVDNKYIKAYVESSAARDFFTLASHGETMEILNLGILRALPIPIPPFNEQRQIISEIERRLSIADQIETTVDNGLKQAERLRQSILKRAFEGRLVPQDPHDEPAEKLLERIKGQKAKQMVENRVIVSKVKRRQGMDGN